LRRSPVGWRLLLPPIGHQPDPPEDDRSRRPKGAYVSLIADGDAQFLYEKFGFRPTAPAAVGMFRTG
jgi:hypothetical protein